MSHDIAKLIFRYILEKARVSDLFEKRTVSELRITACNSLELVSFAKKITENFFLENVLMCGHKRICTPAKTDIWQVTVLS